MSKHLRRCDRAKPRLGLVAALLAAVAAVGAGGCSDSEPEVATLVGQDGSSETTRSHQEAADAFADCLRQNGMPVAVVGDGDNALVTWDAEQVGRAIVRGPNGYAVDRVFNGSNAAEHTEAETAFLEQEREEWGVMLDGVDYSAPYAQCLRSSDYVEPGAAADPGQELRDKQKIAEASNEWAACARNNGWPDLADAQPGNADGYATVPTVLLPATITVQELEALLEHCPAAVPDGDPDQWSPSIDFDADTPEPESGDGGDTTEDGSEHLQQLRDVLYAATHPEE